MTPMARIAAWMHRARTVKRCAWCGDVVSDAVDHDALGYYCSDAHRSEAWLQSAAV